MVIHLFQVEKMGAKLRDTEHQLHLKETEMNSLERTNSRDKSGKVDASTEREILEEIPALNRDMLSLCSVAGSNSLSEKLEPRRSRDVSARKVKLHFEQKSVLLELHLVIIRGSEFLRRNLMPF